MKNLENLYKLWKHRNFKQAFLFGSSEKGGNSLEVSGEDVATLNDE